MYLSGNFCEIISKMMLMQFNQLLENHNQNIDLFFFEYKKGQNIQYG